MHNMPSCPGNRKPQPPTPVPHLDRGPPRFQQAGDALRGQRALDHLAPEGLHLHGPVRRLHICTRVGGVGDEGRTEEILPPSPAEFAALPRRRSRSSLMQAHFAAPPTPDSVCSKEALVVGQRAPGWEVVGLAQPVQQRLFLRGQSSFSRCQVPGQVVEGRESSWWCRSRKAWRASGRAQRHSFPCLLPTGLLIDIADAMSLVVATLDCVDESTPAAPVRLTCGTRSR